MSERRWDVRIGRLVVDGSSPGGHAELERALAEELAKRLAGPGGREPLSVATGARAVGRSSHAVDTDPRPDEPPPGRRGAPTDPRTRSAEATAAAAARAVYSALDT